MSYLDDWYAAVARNIGGGSTKRFFHRGYGDMASAAKIFSSVVDEIASGAPIAPLRPTWGDTTRIEPSVSSCFGPGADAAPTTRLATFESPASAHLPGASRRGELMFVWKDTDRAPTKIAVHLPTTGDQFYYFRKQIALDLLKHDIASVIPMLPYYGPRKPPEQYAHVLPTVEALVAQACAGVTESAAVAAYLAETYPVAQTVFTGVSLGGVLSIVAAMYYASSATHDVGAAPVVAPSCATAFLTGVLHNRLAWDVLGRAPENVAEDLLRVMREEDGASGGVEDVGKSENVRKENGEALNETEAALAAAMECLSLPKIARLTEARRRALGRGAPKLGAVVQVSAAGDRFLGSQQDELQATLRGLCPEAERRDIEGGHISSILFGREKNIVPAVVAAFRALDARRGGALDHAPATVAPTPVASNRA